MRILITAGGTAEKIDDVRSITNHSSGRLGQTIAEKFPKEVEIDYITTKQALQPKGDNIQIYLIESTTDLAKKMTELLEKNPYKAVIHSMAVSDFTPESSVTMETLEETISKNPTDLANALKVAADSRTEKKISSNTDHLVIILKQNPKVISIVKKIQPETILVGFKLLVDVPMIELLNVAKTSLEKNKADFVLANDLTEISGENHHGYLLNKNGKVKEAKTKSEIADLIIQAVTEETK